MEFLTICKTKLLNEFKIIFLLTILFSLIVPTNATVESDNWNEIFDQDLKEWESFGFVREGIINGFGNRFTTPISSGFHIENGILTTDFNYFDYSRTGSGNASIAWHNSTISYGTWSFDIF